MRVEDKYSFKEFVKRLEKDQVGHWSEIARATGVSEATISNWKKLPEAQQAMERAIQRTLKEMENAGRKDWRMWEKKLKLLGVDAPEKVEHTGSSENPIELIINKYGEGGGIDKLPTTEERSSKGAA